MTKKKIRERLIHWLQSGKKLYLSFKSNRDLLVFLLFLMLSTILWFLNALRKEYTTEISYPIVYSDFPDDFILLGKPQDEVQLRIRSLGYNVLPYYFGKILTAEELNVSGFKRVNKEGKHGAYILTRELIKDFSNKMANGVELVEIYPDTLFVNFEKKQRKKVPVRFSSELNFKDQHYQAGEVRLKPDSVEVSGPASYIDTIQFVFTEHKKYNELSDSLTRNLVLKPSDKISYNPGRVVVEIPVQPFAEKNIKIPVVVKNVPDSLKLKCFPSEISVSFTAAISRYNLISSSDFLAEVNYNSADIEGGLPDRIKVKMIEFPEDIKNLNYSPLFVECLFEKKR